jgi:hypothetical protein
MKTMHAELKMIKATNRALAPGIVRATPSTTYAQIAATTPQ